MNTPQCRYFNLSKIVDTLKHKCTDSDLEHNKFRDKAYLGQILFSLRQFSICNGNPSFRNKQELITLTELSLLSPDRVHPCHSLHQYCRSLQMQGAEARIMLLSTLYSTARLSIGLRQARGHKLAIVSCLYALRISYVHNAPLDE